MAHQDTPYTEPTVLESAWRFRWLVLLIAIGFAGLAYLYASNAENWTAEATVWVEDPLSTNLFGELAPENAERYVESQAAIISSRVVATRALEILAEADPPLNVPIDDIEKNLSVLASDSGDLIAIGFTAGGENGEVTAIAVTNATAEAYQEVGRTAAASAYSSALVGLDESIARLESEIDLATIELTIIVDSDETMQEVKDQYDVALQELLALTPPRANANVDDIELFAVRLGALNLRIDTLQKALLENDETPALAVLKIQVDDARARLVNLQTRRDQLAVDSEIAGSGVVFFSPAEVAKPSSVGLYVVVGFLFGMTLGMAIAWMLGRNRRAFGDRQAPQQVLQTRFLADVPDFNEERIRTLLPVTDEPASASAEAFRFVAGAVRLQQRALTDAEGVPGFRSIAVLSSGVFEGKSVVVANTAFAAARTGARVLVVDADFGNQQVTELLTGSGAVGQTMGLTNVGTTKKSLAASLINVARNENPAVSLLTMGTVKVDPSDFFSSPKTQQMLERVFQEFDLVFIDMPPLLRVAYSTTLAGLADRGMVVIRHGSDVRSAEALRHQLDLIGTPLLGYVYNAAPLRTEMTVQLGSTAGLPVEPPQE